MRAATTPAMTLNASVTTTATTTAGAIAPMSLGAIVSPNQKKKIAANDVPQRDEQPLDARPDPRPRDDHAGEQGADGIRGPTVVREAGDEDAEADEQDDGELGVAGGDDRAHEARAPARQGEQPEQERERDRVERTISPAPPCSPRIGCSSAR